MRIECIFHDGELPAIMGNVDWQIHLCINKVILPNITVFFVSIVCKVLAPLHVGERPTRHALLCRPNRIK